MSVPLGNRGISRQVPSTNICVSLTELLVPLLSSPDDGIGRCLQQHPPHCLLTRSYERQRDGEHFSHSPRQCSCRKWLLQERQSRFQNPVVEDGVVGVTGYVEDLHFWAL